MFLSDPRTKTDLFSQVCGKKFSVGGNSNHMMLQLSTPFPTGRISVAPAAATKNGQFYPELVRLEHRPLPEQPGAKCRNA